MTANYIASMCVKANKLDRAQSFFQKSVVLWEKFREIERQSPSSELYVALPMIPYSHLYFNYGSYFMHFKDQAAQAAE